MTIVGRFSVEKAKSVKKAVKRNLTQRSCKKVGISDDSSSNSSSSDSEDSGDDAGSAGTRASKRKPRIDTASDSPSDRGATLRGNTVPENNRDVDHSDGGDHKRGVSRRRFRLRRKKDGKRKARCEGKKQGDIETCDPPQDADKRNGGFGLLSNEKITPADAVLAKGNANEVRFVSLLGLISEIDVLS
jgi:hypothetical protein